MGHPDNIRKMREIKQKWRIHDECIPVADWSTTVDDLKHYLKGKIEHAE